MNPFLISGYKSPEYFCNRSRETEKLLDAIHNSRNVTLVAERRLGKTALLRHVENQVGNEQAFLYFDLYPTLNLKDFIRLLSEIIFRQLEPFSEKLIRKVTAFFSSLNPKFSFDPATGAPNLELTVNSSAEAEKSVTLIFDYIRKSGKKVAVAFDEFQQILNYPEKNVEALLRTEIQKDPDSCYIFSGSRTHLLMSMFNEYPRPFYQSTEILNLGKIDKNDYTKFIASHYNQHERKIDAATPGYIYEINNGITYNIQYTCNKLFSFAEQQITNSLVDAVLEDVLLENEIIYYNYRELVSSLQFKILKAVAKEKIVEKPFSNTFISMHNLGSTSSVKTAIEILLKKGLLINNQGLRVTDWFFSLWLARQL